MKSNKQYVIKAMNTIGNIYFLTKGIVNQIGPAFWNNIEQLKMANVSYFSLLEAEKLAEIYKITSPGTKYFAIEITPVDTGIEL